MHPTSKIYQKSDTLYLEIIIQEFFPFQQIYYKNMENATYLEMDGSMGIEGKPGVQALRLKVVVLG